MTNPYQNQAKTENAVNVPLQAPRISLPTTSLGAPDLNAFTSQLSSAKNKADAASAGVSGFAMGNAARTNKLANDIGSLGAIPAPPVTPRMPEAPTQELRQPIEGLTNFGSILAMFGGALTRRPLVTAMKAAGASMQGFAKGDQEVYERNRQIWADTTAQVQNQLKADMDNYNAVLNNRKLSVDEKQAQIQALAAATGNAQISATLANGDWSRTVDMINTLTNANYKYTTSQANLMKTVGKQQMAQGQYENVLKNIQRAKALLQAASDTGGSVAGAGGKLERALEGYGDYAGVENPDMAATQFSDIIQSLITQAPELLAKGGKSSKDQRDQIKSMIGGLDWKSSPTAYQKLDDLEKLIGAGYSLNEPQGSTQYQIGQELTVDGKRVRIIGLDDPNDPDVELVQ